MTGLTGADRYYLWGGGLPPNLEREINVEFEPGALINKAAANLAKPMDTIDAEIMRGMPFGRNRSEANKPTLEFPFMSFRMLSSAFPEADEQRQNALNQLLKELPKEMQERLAAEMGKSPAERDPVYSALSKTMDFTAAALLWLKGAVNPSDDTEKILRFAEMNLQVTEKAVQGLIKEGEQMIREGLAFLRKMGRSNPDYDELLKHLKNASAALKFLKGLSDEEGGSGGSEGEEEEEEKQQKPKKSKGKNALAEGKKAWAEIKDPVEGLEILSSHFKHSRVSKEMLMLDSFVSIAATLQKTKEMAPGVRSLFFGAAIAGNAIDTDSSETGVVGPKLYRLIDKFTKVLQNAYLKNLSAGDQQLFRAIVAMGTVAAVTAALIFIESDEHIELAKDELLDETTSLSAHDKVVINTFALENMMGMAFVTEIVGRCIPKEKVNEVYGTVHAAEMITKSIELLIATLIIKTARFCDEEAPLSMLSVMEEALVDRFAALQQTLGAIPSEEVRPVGISERRWKAIVGQIACCRLALKKRDYAEYERCYDHFLEAFGIGGDSIEAELRLLHELSHTIRSALIDELEEFSSALTGVAQI